MYNVKEMEVNKEYAIAGRAGAYCMKIDRTTSVLDIVKFVGDHEVPSSNLSFMILSLFHGIHENLWIFTEASKEEAYIHDFENVAFDVILGVEK